MNPIDGNKVSEWLKSKGKVSCDFSPQDRLKMRFDQATRNGEFDLPPGTIIILREKFKEGNYMDKLTDMVEHTKKEDLYLCLRPEIRGLAHQMELKFRVHDDERGDPFDCNDDYFLHERMSEEQIEFEKAMLERKPPSEVWKEGADICNFILMRIVNYERRWKKVRGSD